MQRELYCGKTEIIANTDQYFQQKNIFQSRINDCVPAITPTTISPSHTIHVDTQIDDQTDDTEIDDLWG